MILFIVLGVVGLAIIAVAVWVIRALAADTTDEFDQSEEMFEDELVDSDSYFEMR